MSAAPDPYGVVGHPVSHSLSPFIHGMFARETGQAMSYRIYGVSPGEFATFVAGFFDRGGRGLNVTVTHKIVAVEAANELTARAAHAAAVTPSRCATTAPSSATTPTAWGWCATCATTWGSWSPTAASWSSARAAPRAACSPRCWASRPQSS